MPRLTKTGQATDGTKKKKTEIAKNGTTNYIGDEKTTGRPKYVTRTRRGDQKKGQQKNGTGPAPDGTSRKRDEHSKGRAKYEMCKRRDEKNAGRAKDGLRK